MTALVLPDVEVVLVGWAQGTFDARACTELPGPDELLAALPIVRIQHSGGARANYKVTRPIVDIDVFAATQLEALELSLQVEANLLEPNIVTHGAVLSAQSVTSPRRLPEPNPALHRYNAAYLVALHAQAS